MAVPCTSPGKFPEPTARACGTQAAGFAKARLDESDGRMTLVPGRRIQRRLRALFASTIDPERWLRIVDDSTAGTKVDRVAFASMFDEVKATQ